MIFPLIVSYVSSNIQDWMQRLLDIKINLQLNSRFSRFLKEIHSTSIRVETSLAVKHSFETNLVLPYRGFVQQYSLQYRYDPLVLKVRLRGEKFKMIFAFHAT